MTYTADIPVTGDTLGGTRDRIRTNFQEIDNVLKVNHVEFNATGEGKHKFLQMPVQASPPTTGASEGGVYVKDDSGGDAQLFFREESDGTERQITGGNVGTSGKIPLSGGLYLIWNIIVAPAAGNIAISFPHSGFDTNCFNVTLQTLRDTESKSFGHNIYVLDGSVSKTGFTLIRGAGTVPNIYYTALGN